MLISPQDLLAKLQQPNLRIMDCRFALDNPSYGRQAYGLGHIPLAQYADLNLDLSAPVIPGVSGRHPLPEPTLFGEQLKRWGIDEDSDIVIYDDANGAYASRLWWLLRWFGLQRIQLLNGGLRGWLGINGPLSTATAVFPTSNFQAQPNWQMVVSADEVEANLQARQFRLVDARGLPRFRGEIEPIDPVAGHIPGAICLPFEGNIDGAGRFLDVASLRQRFQDLTDTAVVASCGSGVTACHNIFAMCLAGYPMPRLYAGSWSEWITNPKRPIAIIDD